MGLPAFGRTPLSALAVGPVTRRRRTGKEALCSHRGRSGLAAEAVRQRRGTPAASAQARLLEGAGPARQLLEPESCSGWQGQGAAAEQGPNSGRRLLASAARAGEGGHCGAAAGEEMAGSAVRARGWLGALLVGLQLCSVTLTLEVSVGKVAVIYAKNGSDVLLPCTFTSCIGIEKANFSWINNNTEIFKGVVKNKDSKPEPYPAYQFPIKYGLPPDLPLSKDNREFNVSLLLLYADFSDSGKYTCFVKNPKEKNANHSAIITLKVVMELEKVDNTVTLIIVSVVGGVIGLLVIILLVKKLILVIFKKTQKNPERLVSSSGNDNTENGLVGSKAEHKPTPKA
ncbi:sodium channel subunit beta-4 [Rhineura floridana]|uniref:sodium channel subunit beta-4 n=1 Tax=Rhineura floridana TaxID=261503 RepID=UPI002AC83A61|nr:sodium channel subunit beta-4 [Rhineura floridana]